MKYGQNKMQPGVLFFMEQVMWLKEYDVSGGKVSKIMHIYVHFHREGTCCVFVFDLSKHKVVKCYAV